MQYIAECMQQRQSAQKGLALNKTTECYNVISLSAFLYFPMFYYCKFLNKFLHQTLLNLWIFVMKNLITDIGTCSCLTSNGHRCCRVKTTFSVDFNNISMSSDLITTVVIQLIFIYINKTGGKLAFKWTNLVTESDDNRTLLPTVDAVQIISNHFYQRFIWSTFYAFVFSEKRLSWSGSYICKQMCMPISFQGLFSFLFGIHSSETDLFAQIRIIIYWIYLHYNCWSTSFSCFQKKVLLRPTFNIRWSLAQFIPLLNQSHHIFSITSLLCHMMDLDIICSRRACLRIITRYHHCYMICSEKELMPSK